MSVYRAVLFDFFGTLTRAVARGRAHQNIARWLGCDPRAFTAELNETFLERARGGYGPPAPPPRRGPHAVGARPPRPPPPPAPPPPGAAGPGGPPPREDAGPLARV